mmetsp:Transcript_1245/g.3962  ORF Transcript_1245/g.3962 Transcript_1245/m.3962 type:complete len:235 (-) Transcript_1245:584-1288(-)
MLHELMDDVDLVVCCGIVESGVALRTCLAHIGLLFRQVLDRQPLIVAGGSEQRGKSRHVCGIKLRFLAQYYVDNLRVVSHRGQVQSCRAIVALHIHGVSCSQKLHCFEVIVRQRQVQRGTAILILCFDVRAPLNKLADKSMAVVLGRKMKRSLPLAARLINVNHDPTATCQDIETVLPVLVLGQGPERSSSFLEEVGKFVLSSFSSEFSWCRTGFVLGQHISVTFHEELRHFQI